MVTQILTNSIFFSDIKRPDLVCPGDAIVATEERKAFGTFSWDVPVPQDNSGENLTLNVSNGISPPHRFQVGKTVVRYSTQDSAGLQTSCEFKVTVLGEVICCFNITSSDLILTFTEHGTFDILAPEYFI